MRCVSQVRSGFGYDSADNCIEMTEEALVTPACDTPVFVNVEPSLAPLALTESVPVLEPQGDVSVVEEDDNTPALVSLRGIQHPCLCCIFALKYHPDALCSSTSRGEHCSRC